MRSLAEQGKALLPYLILCGVFVAVWATRGVLTDKEALKYTGAAHALLQGNVTDLIGNYKGFASYVLFLAPFVAAGASAWAVGAQIILALFALRALGVVATRITGSRNAAFAAMLMGALCVPWQQWTIALYTESFFASVLVLFLERATRTHKPDGLLVFWAIVLLFARPVGMLFVGPVLLWKLNTMGTVRLPRWSMIAGYASVLALAIVLPGIPHDQMVPIVEGHVICGFPERPGAMPGFDGSSVLSAQAHLFSTERASYVVGLFFRKVVSLFSLPRAYYSPGHNAFLSLYYACFLLAVVGAWRHRSHPIVRLVLIVLTIYTAFIGLAHDEWSGRFLVPLWPLLVILAGSVFPNAPEQRSS